MPSRDWCPALAAAPDSLNLHSPVKSAQSPARPQSPSKSKGRLAANCSTSTSVSGTKLVEKVRNDRTFSNRIALSAAVNQGSKALAPASIVEPMSYDSVHNPQEAAPEGAEGQPLKLKPPVLIRNTHHLTLAFKGKEASEPKLSNVILCDGDVPTAQLTSLLNSTLEDVEGLTIERCLHGTNSIQNLALTLAGGPPPPPEPEPEEGEQPLDDEEEEKPPEVEAPVKEPWKPKVRKITLLRVSGNPAGLGAAAGEEPNPAALEEITKLLTMPEVAPLKSLSFADSGLLASGGAALAAALLNNGTIETVDLSGNQIGKNDDGASVTAVAQLLQENKFLTDVNLDENDFDPIMSKQIIDAIAASKTRVATPEPPAEPEPEEYTDELPPEEEAPTVEIGFPKEPKDEAAAEGEAAEGEGEAAEEADAAPEEPVAAPTKETKPDADDDEEAEEDEEEEPPAPAAAAPAAAEKEEEDDEDDEEAAEEKRRIQEEKEAAEKAAYEEAKAAWEEKQEQFIWGPQRVHAEWAETVARRVIMQAHIDQTTALKVEERKDREQSKSRQLARERVERDRRSGWTHLRRISLNGNPMGSVGAKAVADMLRRKIPLSEEDVAQAEEAADEFVRKAQEAAEEAANARAEAIAAREAAAREAAEAKEPAEDGEEGEAAAPAPAEPVEEEPLPPLPETKIERPKVEKERDGVATIEKLSLGSCSIGSKGLKALATTLKDNNSSLKTLILRRNKFGVKHAEVLPPGANEDDEDVQKIRIDVPQWVSPGVAAFGDMLAHNRTLVVVDLSFNGMYPATLKALVPGLKANRTLEVLLLDGNHLGQSLDGAEECIGEAIVEALSGEESTITTLGLSNAGIGSKLTASFAKKLFGVVTLRTLNLDANELTAAQIEPLLPALECASQSLRIRALSLRNNHLEGSAGDVLGKMAHASPSLQTLRISDNLKFGDEGFAALCSGLNNHSALKELDASRAGITSLDPLSAILPSISFLQFLDVSDNELNADTGLKFVEQVRRCSALSFVSAWGRTVDFEATIAKAMCEAIAACPTLIHVDIGQGIAAAIAPPVPQAAPEEDEEVEDEEEMMTDAEKIELLCLRNRIALAK